MPSSPARAAKCAWTCSLRAVATRRATGGLTNMTHGLARLVAAGITPLVCGAAMGFAPALAQAYTAAPGVDVADFATGFPNASGIGPVGVTFAADGSLFADHGGTLYRFGPSGGDAAGAAVGQPVSGALSGLAFGKDGSLYAARRTTDRIGDVVQLNPD